MAGSTIYNTTDGPLLIDRAGRMLAARTRSDGPVDVTASPVAGHVKDGRAIVVDEPQADDQPEADKATPTTSRGKRGTTTQEG